MPKKISGCLNTTLIQLQKLKAEGCQKGSMDVLILH